MRHSSDRLEVSRPDVVVVDGRPDPDDPADALAVQAEGRHPLGRGRMALVAALLALAVVAAVTAVLLPGDDNVTTQPASNSQPKAPAAQSAEPRITIEAPATVVAGQPASFTVNYELTNARFSGSIEEWGDGIGGGSVKQERCETTAQTKGPSSGRYTATHTWAEPGTYDVVLGVNTYSCMGTQSRDSKASRTVSVTVVAP